MMSMMLKTTCCRWKFSKCTLLTQGGVLRTYSTLVTRSCYRPCINDKNTNQKANTELLSSFHALMAPMRLLVLSQRPWTILWKCQIHLTHSLSTTPLNSSDTLQTTQYFSPPESYLNRNQSWPRKALRNTWLKTLLMLESADMDGNTSSNGLDMALNITVGSPAALLKNVWPSIGGWILLGTVSHCGSFFPCGFLTHPA